MALYLAADVMLVTPLRDGMNLVAKEYVACRVDATGALVLSEFAGAAQELRDAILVNPHDLDGLKAAIRHAVDLGPDEAKARMRRMRRIVRRRDVQAWARTFLAALHDDRAEERPAPAPYHVVREAAPTAAADDGSQAQLPGVSVSRVGDPRAKAAAAATTGTIERRTARRAARLRARPYAVCRPLAFGQLASRSRASVPERARRSLARASRSIRRTPSAVRSSSAPTSFWVRGSPRSRP